MDINRANMAELFRGYNKIFSRGLESAPSEYRKFCTEVKSSTAVEVYPFLEQFGGMREWIGDRQIKHVSSQKHTVANRDFEDTVAVSRNDIEDDKYNLYGTLIEQLGFSANEIWAELAIEALQGGDASLWIDELSFFNATRKYGEDSTIDNLGSAALSMSAYASARAKMLAYKGHGGKTLRVRPGLLIVGPSNEGKAHDILKSSRKLTAEVVGAAGNTQTITGAIENGYAGTAEILIEPDLGSEWFLADVSRPLKPVVVQKRREAKLTRMDSETDENVFKSKEFIYGADARGGAFLSMPHLIYGSFPA
ncbi:MAG: Mu-like prophage major head subunit gpT family protein [Victivallaceae bacterium]|nr:Mu-like prophage major head subunit gpT family protein [Victivallaceae bacterium]